MSLTCHCKAVRNTLANTQVSQTSKTRPHARNNWGTWRGHFTGRNEVRRHVRLHGVPHYLVVCSQCRCARRPAQLRNSAIHSFRHAVHGVGGTSRLLQSSVGEPLVKDLWRDASKASIPHARAIDVLKGILVLLSPDTLHKFHATRPLAEQYESEMISFLIHVA